MLNFLQWHLNKVDWLIVFYLIVCLLIYLFVCLIVFLFFCLFVYLFICLFDCLFVCLIDCLFVRLFVCLFVCLFVRLFICLFDCLIVYLFVCVFDIADFLLVFSQCRVLNHVTWKTVAEHSHPHTLDSPSVVNICSIYAKITAKQQPTNHCNFHVLTTNHITTKLTNPNQDQRHKYHHLTTILHLTLKMTTAQVVGTSITTNNSLSKDLFALTKG